MAALKYTTGRPKDYSDGEHLAACVLAYFDGFKADDEKAEMPTKAALCLHLEISRQTYNRYKKDPEFGDALKRAELLMEHAWTQRLGGTAPTGAIFYLKNAFKEHFKDRYNTDLTTKGKALASTFDDTQLAKIARRVLDGGAAGKKASR